MPTLRVFTPRSTGIGIASGVLVAISLGQLLGAAWALAILNGLAAGALAQALSIGDLHGGWFDTTDNRRRPGIRALAYAVMMAPTVFVHHYIELRPADEVAVSSLFVLTGFASCILGDSGVSRPRRRRGRPAPASPHPAARRAPRLVADPRDG